jgi:hypothetical protein
MRNLNPNLLTTYHHSSASQLAAYFKENAN